MIIVANALIGCATPLTQQGRIVRQIQPDWSTKCEFLGVINAYEETDWDVADDRRRALNKIRNQVANMGGNAFVISQISSNGFRTLIQADAYNYR